MESSQIELAITISSIILFLWSEVLGKSSCCEYNSIIDIFIGMGQDARRRMISIANKLIFEKCYARWILMYPPRQYIIRILDSHENYKIGRMASSI